MPTPFEPVKEMALTAGWLMISSPASEPEPITKFKTPGGIPAASNSSVIRTAVAGVIDAGLKTTVLPATRAGAIFQTGIATGKFHGVTHATTPSGCLIVYAKFKGNSEGIVSPFIRRDSPAQNSATLIERCNSPRDSAIVLPSSCVSSCATSSLFSSSKRAALATILPRAGAGVARQP